MLRQLWIGPNNVIDVEVKSGRFIADAVVIQNERLKKLFASEECDDGEPNTDL